MIAGNLCRCTGYQNIVKSVRASGRASGQGRHDHQADRHQGPAGRGPAVPARPGPVRRRRRSSGRDTLHAAVLRSPHAHARIIDIDVDDVLDVEGVHVVWTHDDLTGADGRAAAAADPAPDADPRPHPVRAGARTRSTTSARRSRSWSPTTATSPRTRSAGSGSTYEFLPPVVGIEAARAADAPGARRRARQRRRPHGAGERRRAGRDRGRAAHADPRPDHRAQRLHADGGPRHGRALGPRHRPADRCGPRPRPRPACAPRSRPSSASTSARST